MTEDWDCTMWSFNEIENITTEEFFCQFEPITQHQWVVHVGNSPDHKHLMFELSLFDDDLLTRDAGEAPSIAIDLIELAAVVYAVDRAVQPNETTHCRLHVTLPVRCPELLSQGYVQDTLSDILHWYTGYEWDFNFTQRVTPSRDSERPQLFNWRDESRPIDVALWSGGLDCLAGLYNRAYEDKDRQFVLCGTGASTHVHELQKRIVDLLPGRIAERVKLARVYYATKSISGHLPKNPRLRSRGFTFMLIGAMCAYLEGTRTLQIYENGIGAINLRFRESEIGLNHARSVHPQSLMVMSRWLSQVFGEQFVLSNPFLFQTKAQMCQVFANSDDLAVAFETVTCDRRHRRADAKQCGRCSSCILRRHAFAVLGIQDQTPYVFNDSNWLYEPVHFETVEEGNHIPSAIYQVQNLNKHLHAPEPWVSLVSQYTTLAADIVDRTSSYYGLTGHQMRERLIQLFSQYVNEWFLLQDLS